MFISKQILIHIKIITEQPSMRNIKKIIALLPLMVISSVQANTSLEATIASGYRPHGSELDNSAAVMGVLTHKLSGRFDGLGMGFGLVSGSTISGISYIERGIY